jgi:hypothetical protein
VKSLLMLRRLAQFAIRLPALLAVAAILLMTTAAVAPLLHGGDLDHCCAFCHLGHMPILKPATGIVLHAPVSLVSWLAAEQSFEATYRTAGAPSSRGPPA